VRDTFEGIGWVIFGIGGGFFLVTGLNSGNIVTIVVSLVVLAAVAASVVITVRRQRAMTHPDDPSPT